MSDLISRQAAKLKVARVTWEDGDSWYDFIDKCVDCLDDVPSAQPKQQWIPVSKRLPKGNGWYQCTVIVNNLPRTTELFYKNDKWLNNRSISMFNTYDIYGYGYTTEKHKLSYQELISEFDWTENVVAWMPLPEPYKGGKDEYGSAN